MRTLQELKCFPCVALLHQDSQASILSVAEVLPVAVPPVAAVAADEAGAEVVAGLAGMDETVGMVMEGVGVATAGTCCWVL